MPSHTGQVADGKGRKGGQAMNAAGYQTLIVKFSKPIAELDASLTMPKRGEWIRLKDG